MGAAATREGTLHLRDTQLLDPKSLDLELHPSVTLRSLDATTLELFDSRTDLHLQLENLAEQNGALSSELRWLFGELGLCDVTLPLEEVRRRQLCFLDAQAWDERLERLRELLQLSIASVPFYRARAAAYDPAQLSEPQDLARLPLLRKADVRRGFLELCSESVDLAAEVAAGRLELVATSGTTDERLQAISDASLVRVPDDYAAIWAIPERATAPRTAVLTSATCRAERCTLNPGELASRVVREHTLYLPALRDPFSLDDAEVRAIAAELFEFAPAFLFVNPVYAHCLGRRARELQVPLPRVEVLLSSYQYLSRVQRRALEQLFAAPVRNMYSATELGGCQVGLECHRGHLHLREDHCLVELLGREGPVREGELGAVVITTLASRVSPLVRYAVGDLGVRSTEVCDCVLWQSPSLELHGREKDALFVGGRWLTTRRIDEVIGPWPGLDFYCLRQSEPAVLQLEVVPALDERFDGVALQQRLEDWAGTRVRLVPRRRLSPAPSLEYPLSVRETDAPAWLPDAEPLI